MSRISGLQSTCSNDAIVPFGSLRGSTPRIFRNFDCLLSGASCQGDGASGGRSYDDRAQLASSEFPPVAENVARGNAGGCRISAR